MRNILKTIEYYSIKRRICQKQIAGRNRGSNFDRFQTGITTKIWRTTDQETGVSRYQMRLIEDPLKLLEHHCAMIPRV